MTQLTQSRIGFDFEEAKQTIARRVDELVGVGRVSKSATAFPQIVRLETKVPSETAPLAWLQSQSNDDKIYWADRDNSFEMAGVGMSCGMMAKDLNECRTVVKAISKIHDKCEYDIRYYGGIRFPSIGGAQRESTEWEAFGACRFVLPRFELVRRNDHATFVCNIDLQDDSTTIEEIRSELDQLVFDSQDSKKNVGRYDLRTDLPGYDGWAANVEEIISDFAKGKVEKIVLARQTRFDFKQSCNALALLERLTHSTTHCYHYYFQPLEGVAFLGASPEQLYRRDGLKIQSEAIAGTRLRGDGAEDDVALGQELLTSEKDIREHQYVVQNIKTALETICQDLDFDKAASLLKLARVQHLLTHFKGSLKSGVTDEEIIRLLHPTSAVGGYPSEIAQKIIAESEPFDRGWYAGAVGWLGKTSAEFAVAIRSGLASGKNLKLYSGAGIVEGSTAQGEWDEIESKIGSFLNAVTD